jgi:signal transduction histidine kinase
MELNRRSVLVYALLAAVWGLVVVWQIEEHVRVKEASRTSLRNRSKAIANTLGSFIRGLQYRGAVFGVRLQPVLEDLVSGSTNELIRTGELTTVVLLNAAGEPVASAGREIDLEQKDILQEGERWGAATVTFVYPIEGVIVAQPGVSNAPAPVLLPPFTNRPPRRENRPPPDGPPPVTETLETNQENGLTRAETTNAVAERGVRSPEGNPPGQESRPRRPFWARRLNEREYQDLVTKRELHGLVLAMSIDTFRATALHDLWLRFIIGFFAGVSVVGSGVAWRNLVKSSDLQIRLVRASELNTHLKEMNVAAAGLAHETRNPLNIIRGLAQMISKRQDSPPEVREKSSDIINEADKVAAQLNEFINYSRPREVRRIPLALGSIVSEVVRTLTYDLDEKKIRLQVRGEQLNIQADDQLLRQALFNLLINAIQAAEPGGEIRVVAERRAASEASLDVRDNGPGVPPERRSEIFKPYFTTQKTGTGLGLAVVQQIVLAHGWEIECLPNQPKGAIFRITHIKLAA